MGDHGKYDSACAFLIALGVVLLGLAAFLWWKWPVGCESPGPCDRDAPLLGFGLPGVVLVAVGLALHARRPRS